MDIVAASPVFPSLFPLWGSCVTWGRMECDSLPWPKPIISIPSVHELSIVLGCLINPVKVKQGLLFSGWSRKDSPPAFFLLDPLEAASHHCTTMKEVIIGG